MQVRQESIHYQRPSSDDSIRLQTSIRKKEKPGFPEEAGPIVSSRNSPFNHTGATGVSPGQRGGHWRHASGTQPADPTLMMN
jgi:hypothetical protein